MAGDRWYNAKLQKWYDGLGYVAQREPRWPADWWTERYGHSEVLLCRGQGQRWLGFEAVAGFDASRSTGLLEHDSIDFDGIGGT